MSKLQHAISRHIVVTISGAHAVVNVAASSVTLAGAS